MSGWERWGILIFPMLLLPWLASFILCLITLIRFIKRNGGLSRDPDGGLHINKTVAWLLILTLPNVCISGVSLVHLTLASPVVQMNSGGGRAIWSSWVSLWPVMYIGSMIMLPVLVIAWGIIAQCRIPAGKHMAACTVHAAITLGILRIAFPTA